MPLLSLLGYPIHSIPIFHIEVDIEIIRLSDLKIKVAIPWLVPAKILGIQSGIEYKEADEENKKLFHRI